MKELTAPYEKFAYPYDRMMANVNYIRWASYIEDLFRHYKSEPREDFRGCLRYGSIDNPDGGTGLRDVWLRPRRRNANGRASKGRGSVS